MSTLVIGGAGFVGLNIVERFLERGEKVTVFDTADLPAAARAAFEALPGRLDVITGDIRDPAQLAPAFSGRPEWVVCGAAVTAGAERDRTDPERTVEVNLNGFLTALRAARDAGTRRVINLSSSAAYGDAAFGGRVLDEGRTAPDPRTIYAITKFASERVADRLGELWEMDVVNVRLSGVFGRWERQTGVRDTPSPQFQVMQAAIEGRTALVSRRDNRDWIYAPDVAAAVEKLRDEPVLRHALYNISTGKTWSVVDWGVALAQHRPGFVCRLTEAGETANVDLHAPHDRKELSIERLTADTGYKAQFGLASSAADYDAWCRGPEAGYR